MYAIKFEGGTLKCYFQRGDKAVIGIDRAKKYIKKEDAQAKADEIVSTGDVPSGVAVMVVQI